MQQLTLDEIRQSAKQVGDTVLLDLPLPQTPGRTGQFITQLTTALDAKAQEPEWGADRMQVVITTDEARFLLCIEWLCDSIWLESAGGINNSPEFLWDWLQEK